MVKKHTWGLVMNMHSVPHELGVERGLANGGTAGVK